MTTLPRWVPVAGLSDCAALQRLRCCVERDQIRSAKLPAFPIDPRTDWLAHDTERGVVSFIIPIKTVARVPTAAGLVDVRVVLTLESTVREAVAAILEAYRLSVDEGEREDAALRLSEIDVEDFFVLKVTGRRDYLADKTKWLSKYAHVRDRRLCRQQLHVTLVRRAESLAHEAATVRALSLFLCHGELQESIHREATSSCAPATMAASSTSDAAAGRSSMDHNTEEEAEPCPEAQSQDHSGNESGSETGAACDVRMLRALTQAIHRNPLLRLSSAQKALLWNVSDRLVNIPSLLPYVLSCVDWNDADQVEQALALLPKWATPDHPAGFLDLLDSTVANEEVRRYVIGKLRLVPDATFSTLLLQLVNLLKWETDVVSPLVRLLIERALADPHQIGFTLYWTMRAESYEPRYRERFGAILNCYVDGCDPMMRVLLEVQEKLFSGGGSLDQICRSVEAARLEGESSLLEQRVLHDELITLNEMLPPTFVLPIDARMEVTKLVVDQCSVLESSGVALRLVFENAEDGCDPVVVVFTSGADLRQQRLVTQTVRFLDEMWRHQGFVLYLKPYQCVATSPTTGLVEDTRGAVSLRDLSGQDPPRGIAGWFTATASDRRSRRRAENKFVESCAGYCIATWVLGISSRSEDNAMISPTGRFFHTNLDHMMNYHGDDSTRSGRERTPPFVTHAMVQAMGGSGSEAFARFTHTCGAAYNLVRAHVHLLVSMLRPMVHVGLVDGPSDADLGGLVAMLAPELSDDEAREELMVAIYQSVGAKRYEPWRCTLLPYLDTA